MGNRSNKSHMEVEGNRTTRNTSKPAQTEDGTDRQTGRQTYRQTRTTYPRCYSPPPGGGREPCRTAQAPNRRCPCRLTHK